MNLLTHKMKSARSDHYGRNLKIWFPASDGSGNDIVDRILGATVTDVVAAEHTEPHAVNFLSSANAVVEEIEGLVIPRRGMVLAVQKVGTSFALTTTVAGHATTFPAITVSGAAAAIAFGSGANQVSANMAQTAAATNIHVGAAVWDADNLYSYEGINADAALVNTTALTTEVKAHLNANTALKGNMTINSSLASNLYGYALFDFSVKGLPSDLLTGINWMKDHWTAGDKVIYPEWVDRS